MATVNGSTKTNGQSSTTTKITPGGRLRQLLADKDKIIVAPGVYDGFSARIALEVGFDCMYMVSLDHNEFVQPAEDWPRQVPEPVRPSWVSQISVLQP